VGVSRPTVIHWRGRYLEGGLAALQDRKRSGRPRRVDEAQVVVATLTPPPQRLGVTHWSSRLLAAELGLGFASVARIWRAWNLQPWRVETFTFSTDPELEAKVRDVVGLYVHPPENAVVLCSDEKSQVQALQRTAPILQVRGYPWVIRGGTQLVAGIVVAVLGLVGAAALLIRNSSSSATTPSRPAGCSASRPRSDPGPPPTPALAARRRADPAAQRPSVANRDNHRSTVGRDTPANAAISTFARPCARHNTIRARVATAPVTSEEFTNARNSTS
jgi:hypothetical protein